MNPIHPAGVLAKVKRIFQGGVAEGSVRSTVQGYASQFDGASAQARAAGAAGLTRDYYQLATDFYEYGWGESFHFAPRQRGESLKESLTRHQHHLALRLELKPGMEVLDVGCGVGGPMRSIARLSGARITGITISPYQVQRGTQHNARAGLAERCRLVEGDFHRMPFEPGRFGAAYTIEACCHAGDRRGPFGEVFRVLEPGALFAGYDWCLTDRFRAGDPEHERIKADLEKGNGVANLAPAPEIDAALRDVGFEILEARDLMGTAEVPWYEPLDSGLSLVGFRNSRAGARVTHQLVRALELARLAPVGTVETHDVLRLAQRALLDAGRTGIFTPMYFWIARKPR